MKRALLKLKIFASLLAILLFASVGEALAKNIDVGLYVDPFIGTAAHGHTYPGATVPFGMVQVSPDTGVKGWDWCSGYNAGDDTIFGFSHTHLSGTGCGDLGDILLAPTVGEINLPNAKMPESKPFYASTFFHRNEKASPGYYGVKLERDGGISVELTATERVGMHRYIFPKTDKANIIIDLTHGISDQPTDLVLNIVGDHKLTGLRRSKGWAQDQYVYFAAEFSKPFTTFGTVVNDEGSLKADSLKENSRQNVSAEGSVLTADKNPDTEKKSSIEQLQPLCREAKGLSVKGYVTFNASDGKPIIAKVGLSTTSIEAAENNLAGEVPSWNFDETRKMAAASWRKALSVVDVPNASKADLTTFYTALYHSMLAPTLISDLDGKFRGSDHQIHCDSRFATYSTFSLWDTFRAEHPLLTLVRPNLINAFVNSILHQAEYHQDKTLAIWPLYGCETYCMIGYHSFPVIVEAYRKGFRDWDPRSTLSLMLNNSKRNDWWSEKGYIPFDKEIDSVSKTLEFAYDDWALAQFAHDLGDSASFVKFEKRSQEYRNLFDNQIGFVRGRSSDGAWRTPFDPANSKPGAFHDFTEGSAWQYTFFAPHDIPGLISELGGRSEFVKKLDRIFEESADSKDGSKKQELPDFTGVIGQYAHGNEPSHHIAYLYMYAGEPWKTQKRVRQIREQLYTSAKDGLCGNEDCGQMSAWYVLSSMGMYPVNPVTGEYVLGVPAFSKCSLNLPGGKQFTIIGDPEKHFVSNVLLNGSPLKRVYITYDQIMAGGELKFVMSDSQGCAWGTKIEDCPH